MENENKNNKVDENFVNENRVNVEAEEKQAKQNEEPKAAPAWKAKFKRAMGYVGAGLAGAAAAVIVLGLGGEDVPEIVKDINPEDIVVNDIV